MMTFLRQCSRGGLSTQKSIVNGSLGADFGSRFIVGIITEDPLSEVVGKWVVCFQGRVYMLIGIVFRRTAYMLPQGSVTKE